MIDKIVWEAAIDLIVAKIVSISGRVLTVPSQKALYEHINLSRRRTPEMWTDIFEEYPLFGSYVRSISIRNITLMWEDSLDDLMRFIDTGHSLTELYITHTSFRPSIVPILSKLWPKFEKVVLESCTLTEDSLRHMLEGCSKMKSLCIGFADKKLLSSHYCGHWMVDHSRVTQSITSFYYLMDYGQSAFLESSAYRHCLFPCLGALRDVFIRSDYVVFSQVQHLINNCTSTLSNLDVLFICGTFYSSDTFFLYDKLNINRSGPYEPYIARFE